MLFMLSYLKTWKCTSFSLSLFFMTLYGMSLHSQARSNWPPLHRKHTALITGLLGSPHSHFEKFFFFFFPDFKNPKLIVFSSQLCKNTTQFFQCSLLVFAHSATLAFIPIAGIYWASLCASQEASLGAHFSPELLLVVYGEGISLSCEFSNAMKVCVTSQRWLHSITNKRALLISSSPNWHRNTITLKLIISQVKNYHSKINHFAMSKTKLATEMNSWSKFEVIVSECFSGTWFLYT